MSQVVSVGSINMDVVASAAVHPRPGETVAGTSLAHHPGGKGANQAVAAAKAGAPTMMVGRVGSDTAGETLRTFLGDAGVDVAQVRETPGPSGTAIIVVAAAENTIVVVPGANEAVAPADVVGHARSGDVILGQFEIPVETTIAAFEDARGRGATTILNPAPAAPVPAALAAVTDVLVVNETELALLAARDEILPSEASTFARVVRRDAAQVVLVTLGAVGVVIVDGHNTTLVPAPPAKAVDTTGAGDCFTGTVAARLALGDDVGSAVRRAVVAASICVTRHGAGPSMPSHSEVDATLRPDPQQR